MSEPLIMPLERHTWPIPGDWVEDDRVDHSVKKWFREWCRDNFRYEYRFAWVAGNSKDRAKWWVLHLTSHEDWLLLTMKWQ